MGLGMGEFNSVKKSMSKSIIKNLMYHNIKIEKNDINDDKYEQMKTTLTFLKIRLTQ